MLYGYYYNADTILYISIAQPEPQLLAARVKKVYDHTIHSDLNKSIDHGRPFHNTVYCRLHQELYSHLPNHGWSLANLPTQIKDQLPPVPAELVSEGDLVTWLYTLEDTSVYKEINSALVADDEKRLRPWMSMILIGIHYAENPRSTRSQSKLPRIEAPESPKTNSIPCASTPSTETPSLFRLLYLRPRPNVAV